MFPDGSSEESSEESFADIPTNSSEDFSSSSESSEESTTDLSWSFRLRRPATEEEDKQERKGEEVEEGETEQDRES